MPLPVASYLVEFRPRPAGADGFWNDDPPLREADTGSLTPDALAKAAHARGHAEGLAEARAEAERLLGEAESGVTQRLADMRRDWTAEQGDRLAERLTLCIDDAASELAAAVADILTPFVGAAARDRAVASLMDEIRTLIAGEPRSILISGPEDLLARLADALGADAAAIVFEPGDQIDVRVTADHTVVETRLGAWFDRLIAGGE